jgi:hypothetical protein
MQKQDQQSKELEGKILEVRGETDFVHHNEFLLFGDRVLRSVTDGMITQDVRQNHQLFPCHTIFSPGHTIFFLGALTLCLSMTSLQAIVAE